MRRCWAWTDGNGKVVTVEKYNNLAAAEMSGEQNYNQIDGIINNVPNPSFDDRMEEARQRMEEHNKRKEEHLKEKTNNISTTRRTEREPNNQTGSLEGGACL